MRRRLCTWPVSWFVLKPYCCCWAAVRLQLPLTHRAWHPWTSCWRLSETERRPAEGAASAWTRSSCSCPGCSSTCRGLCAENLTAGLLLWGWTLCSFLRVSGQPLYYYYLCRLSSSSSAPQPSQTACYSCPYPPPSNPLDWDSTVVAELYRLVSSLNRRAVDLNSRTDNKVLSLSQLFCFKLKDKECNVIAICLRNMCFSNLYSNS